MRSLRVAMSVALRVKDFFANQRLVYNYTPNLYRIIFNFVYRKLTPFHRRAHAALRIGLCRAVACLAGLSLGPNLRRLEPPAPPLSMSAQVNAQECLEEGLVMFCGNRSEMFVWRGR